MIADQEAGLRIYSILKRLGSCKQYRSVVFTGKAFTALGISCLFWPLHIYSALLTHTVVTKSSNTISLCELKSFSSIFSVQFRDTLSAHTHVLNALKILTSILKKTSRFPTRSSRCALLIALLLNLLFTNIRKLKMFKNTYIYIHIHTYIRVYI